MKFLATLFSLVSLAVFVNPATAWHDETHLAIAKMAGYDKWYLAAGADMAKIKAGAIEQANHYAYNPPESHISSEMVLDQAAHYDDPRDRKGHLYGAIIAAVRNYREARRKGQYAEYHLGFCAHYVGDLSQPLHHLPHNAYNRRYHQATDGIIEGEVLSHLDQIKLYGIEIHSEADLAQAVADIANLSLNLARTLAKEDRLLSKAEAYRQIGHSASLLKAILRFVEK
jgi:hypothetical protein